MTMKLPDAMSDQETAGQGAQAMARTLGALFVTLRVVIVLALLSLAFGGLFSVKENEEAMLFHFGRLEARDGSDVLRSGNWYWAWPYPIDEVKRIPAQRSISITSRQFWPKVDPNNLQALQGGPQGPGANVLRPGEDGYLLTGDANIMHMAWTLTYRIADPKAYYLNFYEDPGTLPDGKPFPMADRRGVETLIQSVLDDAVLGEVASWRVEDVLVSSRAAVPGAGDVAAARRGEALAAAVRARLAQRLSLLDLGIEVQQLSLVDTQPPAYNDDNNGGGTGVIHENDEGAAVEEAGFVGGPAALVSGLLRLVGRGAPNYKADIAIFASILSLALAGVWVEWRLLSRQPV